MSSHTQDLVDLTVVVDRSGSMQELREEAERGLNEFFEQQKLAAPNTRVTLVQFDTVYDFVHKDALITDIPRPYYTLVPRGLTALLDATGRAAGEALQRFLDKGQEISKKIFVVLTDGQENSSSECTKDQVRAAIHSLRDQACEVVFLGANIDAFSEAGALGIYRGTTANFEASEVGMSHALSSLSQNVTAYSTGSRSSLRYTQEQRDAMKPSSSPSTPIFPVKPIPRSTLDQLRKEKGLSWHALEKAAGVSNATVKKYVRGETQSLSESTRDRLIRAFPSLKQ